MEIAGGNRVNSWWAQIGPGGRPSMGPVSPGLTPSNAGFKGCWVVLACAVGAGLSAETGFRGSTSKRGMGWVKAWTPKSGLRGAPVGIDAYALFANGLKPLVRTKVPAADMSPILIRSRRETCPWESAFTISARFLRAFSASRTRAFDAFRGRYTGVPPLSVREEAGASDVPGSGAAEGPRAADLHDFARRHQGPSTVPFRYAAVASWGDASRTSAVRGGTARTSRACDRASPGRRPARARRGSSRPRLPRSPPRRSRARLRGGGVSPAPGAGARPARAR